VLAFSGLRAPIWGSHIETPYKKKQLKKAMPLAIYGLWRAGHRPASCALPAAAAAACSLLAVLLLLLLLLLLQLLQLLLLLLKLLLLLLLLLGLYCCSCCPPLPLTSPPPPSSLSSCCSMFRLRLLLQFLLHILLLPRLLLLFLISCCCFLAFGRFSLVPSEGPLISDQLRRGLLLCLRFLSTYSYLLLAHHHPSRAPLTV
jgi:hypothetical protein